MEVGRGEIRIGRIVFVPPTDSGVLEQNAAASVRLQTVLMGINGDGVSFPDGGESLLSVRFQIFQQGKVSAVGGIGVNAKIVFLTQGKRFMHWIDGARRGRSHGFYHGPYTAAL